MSVIQGTALSANRGPLPNARVQLRNIGSGRVEDITTTNHIGEFSFIADPDNAYIVELADDATRVLAASEMVAARAGETVGVLVVLPARIPAVAGLFRSTAAAIVSAAAGTGITAVTTTSPPASPER